MTGAGIVGVALGFGAQTLVRDLIGGFFLILENQIRVGDVAAINGIGGLVEAINLRTTVLRDEEGTVHVFPTARSTRWRTGACISASTWSTCRWPTARTWMRSTALLTRDRGDSMQKEDAYKPFILEPLEVIGVDAFEENAVRLKVRIKTAPLKQWFVGRELRRRINEALRERGIEMWTPQRTVAIPSPR